MTTTLNTQTLEEARTLVQSSLDDGIECPACDQYAKVYRRKINSSMARTIITLYREAQTSYAHGPSLPGDTHEISQLAWWGLIEEANETRPDGGRAGWWRLTPDGVLFVLGKIEVPKFAVIYNSTVKELDDSEWVTIHDALGTRFNYADLMAGV